MGKDRKRESGGFYASTALALLILAIILFVLSIGPANLAADSGSMSWDAYHAIYRPLVDLDRDTQPGKLLNWYTEWWSPPPPYQPFHTNTKDL